MASTVLPNGIIIPEKYSRDWYNDLYHNWQELDNLLGGGGANDGTLTIQKNGSTVGTFSANQATDETINIEVPTVNDATLTIQKNGTTVDTFTANSSTDKTVNISVPTKTSDLTNDSGFITSDNTKIPLAGSNAISGDLIPSTDNSIDIGSSTKNIKALYTKGITIDGKTIDTDANGNLVYDGNIVDTIEEQGEGYIRYSNGLQICWGTITWQSACASTWGSLYSTDAASGSYAKSFIEIPFFSASSNIGGSSSILDSDVGGKTTTPQVWLCRGVGINDVKQCTVRYTAIGRWK